MSDTSPSIPPIVDVSAVSGRRLPFGDGLAVTQPLDLSEIRWETTHRAVASTPGRPL